MKIDFIEIEENVIENGKSQLSDSLKTLLYEYDKRIFDDFCFDTLYIEPELFFYFFRNDGGLSKQYLLNNYENWGKPLILQMQNDFFGTCHIPNFGIIKNNTNKQLLFKNGLFLNENGMKIKLQPEVKISNSNISICQHVPNILKNYLENVSFDNVKSSIQKSIPNIEGAWEHICNFSPDFGKCINETTKEISINNFPKMPSFASLNYFGTTFININGQNPTDVFFMDDIAHQSGHTIFYLCTLNPDNFFKYPFNSPLKDFTGVSYETREIYGCLHSMFTLCTIIHTLNNYLSKGCFEITTRNELIGRIGFYLHKLLYDVNNLLTCDIFTSIGLEYFEMFRKNSIYYSNLYDGLFKKFIFNRQNYYFNMEIFIQENKKLINEKHLVI